MAMSQCRQQNLQEGLCCAKYYLLIWAGSRLTCVGRAGLKVQPPSAGSRLCLQPKASYHTFLTVTSTFSHSFTNVLFHGSIQLYLIHQYNQSISWPVVIGIFKFSQIFHWCSHVLQPLISLSLKLIGTPSFEIGTHFLWNRDPIGTPSSQNKDPKRRFMKCNASAWEKLSAMVSCP